MEQLIVIAIAALVAVVILALFGKGIRIFGLRISWRDGMTVNFERNEDKEPERKKVAPRLDELQEPWDRTDVSSLPVQRGSSGATVISKPDRLRNPYPVRLLDASF
jgi:hypothetical protein